jgi:hypothetical protein
MKAAYDPAQLSHLLKESSLHAIPEAGCNSCCC